MLRGGIDLRRNHGRDFDNGSDIVSKQSEPFGDSFARASDRSDILQDKINYAKKTYNLCGYQA